MSGHDPSVVSRILSEADMAARPGQYDRLVAIANEVAALTRWKDEATAVIEAWEQVHRLLGSPGFLGESKAAATYDEVRDLLGVRTEATNDRADAEFWERRWCEVVDQREQMQAERDAARAEVAALREQKPIGTVEFIETGMVPRARAETRREVLADLRAKVEGMRDEAKADPVGSAVWRTTAYESVLALIDEEADRG